MHASFLLYCVLIFSLQSMIIKFQREILMFLVDGHRVQLALVEVPLNSSQDCQDPEGTSVNIVYESVNHIKDAMARLPAQSRPKISVTEV